MSNNWNGIERRRKPRRTPFIWNHELRAEMGEWEKRVTDSLLGLEIDMQEMHRERSAMLDQQKEIQDELTRNTSTTRLILTETEAIREATKVLSTLSRWGKHIGKLIIWVGGVAAGVAGIVTAVKTWLK